MAITRRQNESYQTMPLDLLAAMEHRELTQEQLRRLIAIEASDLGLGFDEAVGRARDGSLPKNVVGLDLELLVELLTD
jgi:hypothetical protein